MSQKTSPRRGLAVSAGVAVATLALLAVYLRQTTGEQRAEPHGEALVPGAVATPAHDASSPPAAYRFDRPVARFDLPPDLVEISGLTVLDEETLGAVQDEEGALYVLDRETGEVSAVMPFGPPGDYEGVELVGDRLYVLRADGVLVDVEGWGGGTMRSREIALGLPGGCDAEGLGHDAARDRLLIACKEDGGPDLGGHKALYAFDLAAGRLDPQPAFVIDPEAVPGDGKLKPSAIAVHPVTGDVVVLSSGREVLVALDAGGAVTDVWDWADARLEQPEGLAFLPNGDLFIASEGDDRPAVLVRFAYEEAP